MKTVLIIRNRNAGFFSIFVQIMNNLVYINNDVDIIPIVELTKEWGYGTDCVWKQFFNPLNSYEIQENDKIIETKTYYPNYKLKNMRRSLFSDFRMIPSIESRIEFSKVIKLHIKLKDLYKSKFDKFYEDKLKNIKVIGVNFRGTDSRSDPRRKTPSYSKYKDYINNILKEDKNCKIFCASDEKEFIDYINSNYPNITYFNNNPFIGSKTACKRFKHNYDCPSFINKNPIASLEGALFDYYILSKCNYIIFHQGSIPLSVLFTNPDIVPIVVKEGGYRSVLKKGGY